MVEPKAGDHVLLHAKDEIARLKVQLKDYQSKEMEVISSLLLFLCVLSLLFYTT